MNSVLHHTVTLRTVHTKNIEFNDLDDSVIWDMLLSDRDAKSIDNYDSHDFTAEMTVGVSIPLLGYENIAFKRNRRRISDN